MNVLVIAAHPRTDSYSHALANAYSEGAEEAQCNVQKIEVSKLEFNPNVTHPSPNQQLLENDILNAQKSIAWADHLVFVYPTWWGSMPALLKAFIDRVFTSGFAFDEIEGGTGYAKLLRGKTAQLITSMDTPLFVYKWIYKSPGHRMLGTATLKFCGIEPVRILNFSPIRNSTLSKREEWLDITRSVGFNLRKGHMTRKEKLWQTTKAWLQAIRLQFYPMTALAYAVGAFGASFMGYGYSTLVFWIGFLWIFCLEVATVLINEREDFESDEQNKYFSPFSGGSRVIVDKIISKSKLNIGILVALLFTAVFACILLIISPASTLTLILAMAVSFALAVGYTSPPLKLSYRGLAAIDVGFTHSFGVIVCGFIFQGGLWNHTFPWLLSIPLFFSILPSIILAGIPDREADNSVGKKTVAVRFGRKNASKITLAFTILATIIGIFWFHTSLDHNAYTFFIYGTVLHAAYLSYRLYKYFTMDNPSKRIDSLIALSLAFILWYVLIPFFVLL